MNKTQSGESSWKSEKTDSHNMHNSMIKEDQEKEELRERVAQLEDKLNSLPRNYNKPKRTSALSTIFKTTCLAAVLYPIASTAYFMENNPKAWEIVQHYPMYIPQVLTLALTEPINQLKYKIEDLKKRR